MMYYLQANPGASVAPNPTLQQGSYVSTFPVPMQQQMVYASLPPASSIPTSFAPAATPTTNVATPTAPAITASAASTPPTYATAPTPTGNVAVDSSHFYVVGPNGFPVLCNSIPSAYTAGHAVSAPIQIQQYYQPAPSATQTHTPAIPTTASGHHLAVPTIPAYTNSSLPKVISLSALSEDTGLSYTVAGPTRSLSHSTLAAGSLPKSVSSMPRWPSQPELANLATTAPTSTSTSPVTRSVLPTAASTNTVDSEGGVDGGYEAGSRYEGRVKRFNPYRGYGFLTATHRLIPVNAAPKSAEWSGIGEEAMPEELVDIDGVAHRRLPVSIGDIFVHYANIHKTNQTSSSAVAGQPPHQQAVGLTAPEMVLPSASTTANPAGRMSEIFNALPVGSMVRFSVDICCPVRQWGDDDCSDLLEMAASVALSSGYGGAEDAFQQGGRANMPKSSCKQRGLSAVDVVALPPRGALLPWPEIPKYEAAVASVGQQQQLPVPPPAYDTADTAAIDGAENAGTPAVRGATVPPVTETNEEKLRRLGRAGFVCGQTPIRVAMPRNWSLNGLNASLPPPPPPPPMQ